MQEGIEFRKPRDFSAVVSDSFVFLKQEFASILQIFAIYVLPFVLLYAGAQIWYQSNILAKMQIDDPEFMIDHLGQFYLSLFVLILLGVLVQGMFLGTFYTFVKAYIERGKANFTVQEISQDFFSNSLRALGGSLIVTVMVIFGMIFCIIPGIYLANILSPLVFILVFEGGSFSAAYRRSVKLVNRRWWNTFAVNLVGMGFVLAVIIVFSLIGSLAGVSNGTLAEPMAKAEYSWWYWLFYGVNSVFGLFAYIIPATFIVLQYFSLAQADGAEMGVNDSEHLPPDNQA